MSSIKEFNTKIKSLKNTRKITKTMKMVSASKLRKAQQAQANAKQYAQNVTALISRLSTSADPQAHPLLRKREPVKNALVLVYTSDKGLCGAFNHNAHKQVLSWINTNRSKYENIYISCCGRRGHMFFHRRGTIRNYYKDITLNPAFLDAESIGREIIQDYNNGVCDEVYLSYNQFFSPLLQKTIFEKVLPIEAEALIREKVEKQPEYIYEPQAAQLLEFLIQHFLFFKIYFALLENSAGEHGARMSAMDNATRNASDLIDQNILFRNRARQAAITTELTEIVAGAEVLK